MYTTVEINNFRSIESLRIGDLRRINLVVGLNNSGKTSVLEALFLLCGATNASLPLSIAELRGQRVRAKQHPDPALRTLFHDLDPSRGISLSGRWAGESNDRTLEILAVRGDRLPTDDGDGVGALTSTSEWIIGELQLHYVSADGTTYNTALTCNPKVRLPSSAVARSDFVASALLSARTYNNPGREGEQYGYLLRYKQEADVIDGLRLLDPRVERLEIVAESGGPTIYADVGLPTLLPLSACGEGMVRLFSIIVQLTAVRNGVLLIDEIDNGLHYSVMRRFWPALRILAERHNVQIFGTTHNDELLRTAVEAFEDHQEELALLRIDRTSDGHRVSNYSDDVLQAVVSEDFEVRG